MCKIILSALLVFIAVSACAQTPKEDSIKAGIIELSNQWSLAIVKRDSLVLEKILSPEFTLASAVPGPPLPRKEWMHNTLRVLVTDSAAFVTPLKVTVFVNEALVEGILHWKVRNDKNQLRNNEYVVADIWRFNGAQWQVVHRMSKLHRRR